MFGNGDRGRIHWILALLPVACSGDAASSATDLGTVDNRVVDSRAADGRSSEERPADTRVTDASGAERMVVVGTLSLYVRVVGELPADHVVVGIHGGPGLSAHYMTALDPLASADLAVVTYEQRGVNRSSLPDDGYALADQIGDLEAIRENLGVAKIHVLGHSWGGMIAMGYAATYPEKVASLLLMGSMPPTGQSFAAGRERFAARLAQLQQSGVVPDPLPGDDDAAFQAILPAYFHDPAFPIPGELTETRIADAAQIGSLSYLSPTYDLVGDLAGLNMPALVLFGASDPFGTAWGDDTAAALTSAAVTRTDLPDCGHFWAECPGDFSAAVDAFINGL